VAGSVKGTSVATGTSAALADALSAADPGAAFLNAGLMAQRSIIDSLCVVRLRRGTRYSRTFDPETVDIRPR
jgi:site-specific DNA recombinase